MLTQAQLHQVMVYNPETGVFTWLPRQVHHFTDKTWNSRFANKSAGCLSSDGYRQIRIGGRSFRAARLAWLYMTGSWPTDLVDHIDGNQLNDCWINLREATQVSNGWNRKLNVRNKSGYPGVAKTSSGKWRATIRRHGEHYNLGLFDSFNDAKTIRIAAELIFGGRTRKGL